MSREAILSDGITKTNDQGTLEFGFSIATRKQYNFQFKKIYISQFVDCEEFSKNLIT